jgi:hypothetical protein
LPGRRYRVPSTKPLAHGTSALKDAPEPAFGRYGGALCPQPHPGTGFQLACPLNRVVVYGYPSMGYELPVPGLPYQQAALPTGDPPRAKVMG